MRNAGHRSERDGSWDRRGVERRVGKVSWREEDAKWSLSAPPLLRLPLAQEWSGEWGDDSPSWDQHPRVKEHLHFAPQADGLFWMAWDDFRLLPPVLPSSAFALPPSVNLSFRSPFLFKSQFTRHDLPFPRLPSSIPSSLFLTLICLCTVEPLSYSFLP